MTDERIGPARAGPLRPRSPPREAPHQPLRRRLLLGETAPEGFTPDPRRTTTSSSRSSSSRREAATDGRLRNGDGDELFYLLRRRRDARDALRRPPGRRRGLRPRPARRRPPIPDRRSPFEGILFELRGGLHVPHAVPEPGRPAPDGRALHAPRLRASRLPRPAPGPDARSSSRRTTRFVERFPAASPFDVVGWDGTVWPFAFPILAYQPRTGLVHLPPTIHSTFAGARRARLLLRPARDGHPPRRDPLPLPAHVGRLRRDHLLRPRQLHEPARRRAEGGLAPPRRRPPRPAPGRLRRRRSGRGRPTSSPS